MGVFTQDVQSAAPADVAGPTIAINQSLSGAVDLGDQRLHRVLIPAGWDAAAITFQASADGQTYRDLYDKDGEVTLPLSVVGANRAVVVPQETFFGVRWLKIRSGTSASPVTQSAARAIGFATVAR